MGIISNAYLLMIISSENFAFLFVDPEKETKSELIESTREVMLALALLVLVLTFLAIFFFKNTSSSLIAKRRGMKKRNENEVTQLTTGQNFSTKALNEAEDGLLQGEGGQDDPQSKIIERGKEGLSYTEQLIGVLQDPAFVFISLSSMIVNAISVIYTNNINAMSATYGFLEVKN